jgi:predicted nucleic acid-binding Zn ribbon protein
MRPQLLIYGKITSKVINRLYRQYQYITRQHLSLLVRNLAKDEYKRYLLTMEADTKLGRLQWHITISAKKPQTILPYPRHPQQLGMIKRQQVLYCLEYFIQMLVHRMCYLWAQTSLYTDIIGGTFYTDIIGGVA